MFRFDEDVSLVTSQEIAEANRRDGRRRSARFLPSVEALKLCQAPVTSAERVMALVEHPDERVPLALARNRNLPWTNSFYAVVHQALLNRAWREMAVGGLAWSSLMDAVVALPVARNVRINAIRAYGFRWRAKDWSRRHGTVLVERNAKDPLVRISEDMVSLGSVYHHVISTFLGIVGPRQDPKKIEMLCEGVRKFQSFSFFQALYAAIADNETVSSKWNLDMSPSLAQALRERSGDVSGAACIVVRWGQENEARQVWLQAVREFMGAPIVQAYLNRDGAHDLETVKDGVRVMLEAGRVWSVYEVATVCQKGEVDRATGIEVGRYILESIEQLERDIAFHALVRAVANIDGIDSEMAAGILRLSRQGYTRETVARNSKELSGPIAKRLARSKRAGIVQRLADQVAPEVFGDVFHDMLQHPEIAAQALAERMDEVGDQVDSRDIATVLAKAEPEVRQKVFAGLHRRTR